MGPYLVGPYGAQAVHNSYGAPYGAPAVPSIPTLWELKELGVAGLKTRFALSTVAFRLQVATAANAAGLPGAGAWMADLYREAGQVGVTHAEELRRIEEDPRSKQTWEKIPWKGLLIGGVGLAGLALYAGTRRRNPNELAVRGPGYIRYKSRHVEGQLSTSDWAAAIAIGIGLVSLLGGFTSVVGIPILLGGFGYFGIKALRPDWLPNPRRPAKRLAMLSNPRRPGGARRKVRRRKHRARRTVRR